MWDEPALVGGVAGEAAAQVIVDPATSHLVESVTHDMEGLVVPGAQMLAEQHAEIHRVGELGCLAESTVLWVKVSHERSSGAVEQPGSRAGRCPSSIVPNARNCSVMREADSAISSRRSIQA